MENYIDGLVGQQKLYNTAFFLTFVNVLAYVMKERFHPGSPIFSNIPIIGINSPDDYSIKILITMFSVGISLWVSVSLLWWLYSFNKHHSKESLDIDYLPGILFMPLWIKLIAWFVMTLALIGIYPPNGTASQTLIVIAMTLITVTPLMIADSIRRKFKKVKTKRRIKRLKAN